MKKLSLLTLVCAAGLWADAKIFRNAYVSFELPQKWKCKIEGTEWVCSSTYRQQSREAVIVLTAKEAGPVDNLPAYESHLKQPRLLPSTTAQPVRSEVVHVKRRKIANQDWVDGMHKSSEIPNYFTRYLATVRNKVAILVTFSAHYQHYTKYSSDFFRAIQSLRVVADKSILKSKNTLAQNRDGQGVLGQPTIGLPGLDTSDFPEEPKGRSSSSNQLWSLLVAILALGGYIYIKKFKKR